VNEYAILTIAAMLTVGVIGWVAVLLHERNTRRQDRAGR